MAEQSLLSTLLSPTLAAQMASKEEEERIAQAGSPLLQEAARTAGMFTQQLGGLTGTDTRSPAVQKVSQMQSIIQGAEGADIYEKMENALPQLESIDPAMAINLGKMVTERKATARGIESKNALAQYFAQKGRPELAEAVASGEMTPGKALEIMQKDRELGIKEQKGKPKTKAVTTKQVADALPLYSTVVARNPDLAADVEELANLDWTDYVVPFTSVFGFKVTEDPDEVKAQIVTLATERAEQIKQDNPQMSREEAFAKALSDMKQGSYASSEKDPFANVSQ